MFIASIRIQMLLAAALVLALAGCGQSGSSSTEAEVNSPIDYGKPYVGARVAQSPAAVGDPVVIEIIGTNFPLLEGGGIDLAFDPSVLQIDRIELDPGWEFATRSGQIDNAGGSVDEILFTSYVGKSGDVKIATVYGSIVGPGETSFRIDVAGLFPFASDGGEVDMQFETAVFGMD